MPPTVRTTGPRLRVRRADLLDDVRFDLRVDLLPDSRRFGAAAFRVREGCFRFPVVFFFAFFFIATV
jgi:hypothetical protein